MDIFLYSIIFIIGALFGSFFTLAVYRIPLKKDITHERSYCPNCNHKLGLLDLIPIVSYLFLRGKCRYCKQKIRPRYLLLEILSGIVFVLFAMSINLQLLPINISNLVYFIFGLLYIATLFIIAGIDKEKHKIEKSVLLFGYIIEALYIIYLYILEKDPNIYRYVIYLGIICLLIVLDTLWLRKKANTSYVLEVFLLTMLLLTFSHEAITILTIVFTILSVSMYLIIKRIKIRFKTRAAKCVKAKNAVIPFGFYLCVTNIITLIIVNFLHLA